MIQIPLFMDGQPHRVGIGADIDPLHKKGDFPYTRSKYDLPITKDKNGYNQGEEWEAKTDTVKGRSGEYIKIKKMYEQRHANRFVAARILLRNEEGKILGIVYSTYWK